MNSEHNGCLADGILICAEPLSDLPKTRVSLVLRLSEPSDVQAWHEFADVYAPAIYRLALGKGLQPADAEDVTQNVLLGVARAIERFSHDQERATFRTWLGRIARNLIADHFRREGRRPATSSIGSWHTDPAGDVDVVDPDFEAEHRQALFESAATAVRGRVSESTWQAFHLAAIEELPAGEVAQRIGMRVGAVYVARSRVLKLLRKEVERLTDESIIDDSPSSPFAREHGRRPQWRSSR